MEGQGELEGLISACLGRVEACSWQPLDSVGLHFSSEVRAAHVQVRNKDDSTRLLRLVVKVMPDQDKQIENSSKLGFKKEAAFYKYAVPQYYEIQENNGLEKNNFPKLIGSLDNYIILSDLRSLEYSTKKKRLDKVHTKLVLYDLAKFHATGIALKLSKPDVFQSKIAEAVTPALRNATNVNKEVINKNLRREVCELLKSTEGLESFADPVDVIIKNIDNQKLPASREPYATVLHNDLWLGNIMFRYSTSNIPTAVAFIDFQNTIYNSPARDVVYFLFTSVEKDVLADFDSIIYFYHLSFVRNLSILGFETSEYTLSKFVDEINTYGPTKLKHIILLFKTLSGSSENYKVCFKRYLTDIMLLVKDRGWL